MRVIGADDNQFVTVNGVTREMHNALTGRVTRGDRVEDTFELTGADRRRQHGDEESSSFKPVGRSNGLNVYRNAVRCYGTLRQDLDQLVARQSVFARYFRAQHQRASNGDLRDVNEVDVVTLETVQGLKQVRANAMRSGPLTVTRKRGARHRTSVEVGVV